MVVIPIAAKLITGAELIEKVRKVKDTVWPQPSAELVKRFRWFQCTVRNATQFQIRLDGVHWDSGKFCTPPDTAGVFEDMTFGACNSDHGVAKGVTGGFSFCMMLDEEQRFYFSVGLATLGAGQANAGVVESESSWDGFDAATRDGNYIESKNKYKSKNEDGNEQEILFRVSAQPGKEMRIEVDQIVMSK
ncbi:hypothetical protein FVEN_g776 [Fusarium venenatum]|uniref:Uncharacterized protein n=1 Tax=Fusarium venenatum TaxID=56646 RepID=A0A2L2TQ69_9HYPO|nr:uncharacterized protein FVRRES_10820 [Fusarium venenatum]KAG8361369.1 hypothetical protein FVEN_g776 [Fusarium venenatum]KAH6967395.1 hypothetical protein EDB82DRAFT_563202 [Fusarium venenatum]CEI70743.1 unnamed protein product [Fusarium venenatum]